MADDLAPRIANKLLGQIREVQDLSLDPELTSKLIPALQLAKESLLGQARQVSGLVLSYEDDKLTLDLSSLNIGQYLATLGTKHVRTVA